MYIIELSSTRTEDELTQMVQWCNVYCNDSYYYFEPNFYLEECAKFWFEDQDDTIAFRLRFNVNEGS